MITSNGSRGKGSMTRMGTEWVIAWEDGSRQGFKSLGDAMYALAHNGEASPTLAEAHALIAQARPEMAIRADDMRRNPVTGRFIGGGRGE